MQEKLSNGLQCLFEKNKGVDTLYLYNDSKSVIKIKQLRLRNNVFVGAGTPSNLTKDTVDWLTRNSLSVENVGNAQKIQFLRSKLQVDFSDLLDVKKIWSVTELYDNYFCAWGVLSHGSCLRDDLGDHYELTWNYQEPQVIGPYEQVELSYANSFYGLPIRSAIAGVQYLPRVFVQLDVDTSGVKGLSAKPEEADFKEVQLDAVILQKEGGERRVLDRNMADKARSSDLTRRFVGYYANYFMYERDYFVTDIPIDHINCISYGMMSVQEDGSLCSSDEWSDTFQVAALQFMKQLNPSLQVSLIVGGWPKSPSVTFSTAPSFPSKQSVEDGHFRIVQLEQKNQWEVLYSRPSTPTLPGAVISLQIDREPEPYSYFALDPQRLFDDNAPKRGLYAWLTKHGASYEGCSINLADESQYQSRYQTADQSILDADLELMSLLGKAFDAQSSIAPFAMQFRQISRNPAQRERLAQSAATALRTLGFDGFEVDWEYPLVEDGDGYLDLLCELRRTLGDKQLAVAVPCAPDKISRLTERQWRGLGDQVDHVNVMSYDYHGSWSQVSWFNAPMGMPDPAAGGNRVPENQRTYCLNETVRIFLQLVARNCLTRRQLTLGLAGYGRAVQVEAVNDDNKGLLCRIEGRASPGEPFYREIVAMREAGGYKRKEGNAPALGWPGMKFVSEMDPFARSPYAYSTLSGVSLTYDDPRSLREKVRLALAEQWGGVMIWDLSDDVPVSHQDSLIAAVSDELRQCHPATAVTFCEQEQDPWLVAARKDEPVVALTLASRVVEYAAQPASHAQDLGFESIEALAALPGGAVAAISAAGLHLLTTQYQGFETQRTLAFDKAVTGRTASLPLSDGRLLLRRADGTLLVLRLQDGQCQKELELAGSIHDMSCVGPNQIAALQGQSLLVWTFDASGFQQIHRVDHSAQLVAFAPLSGGQLLLVSNDGEAFLWTAEASGLQPLSLTMGIEVPRLLRLLPDGRLLACLGSGALQLWQVARDDGRLQALEVTVQPWNGIARDWLDVAVLPSGGFALLDRERLVLWQANPSTRMYEVIQQIVVPGASALALLQDASLLVAQGQSLQRLEFPGWPRVQAARRTPWQVTDKDGLTALHWLAKGTRTSSLEQWLAIGAPADWWLPGTDKTLLAEAMRAGRPQAAAMLLRAGAPLWQAEHAASHGQLLNAELLAELLPASLIAALPAENRVARVKPGFDLSQLPSDCHDLLTGYPLLTGRMAICVYLLVPLLARQLQNLLSYFEIDDDCLTELRQECPRVVAQVQPLRGRGFADEASLRLALTQQLGEADPGALDAVQNACRRVKPQLAGEGRYDLAIFEQGVTVLQRILDQALEQPLLALQRKQLLEQFVELAAPQPGDLLNIKADVCAADLPAATIDFLTLYPRATAQMAEQLKVWSPALADLITGFSVGSPQPVAMALPDEAIDRAHRVMRQLLVAVVHPAMTQARAADFLASYASAPWSPRVDPLAQPLAWVNWAFDPPLGSSVTREQGQVATPSGTGSAWDVPGQASGVRPAQQSTPGSSAPDLDDHRGYIAKVRAAGDAMAEKSKPGKDYFADYKESKRAKVESAHPLTEEIRSLKDHVASQYRELNAQSEDLHKLDTLSLDRQYQFVAQKRGIQPDTGLNEAQQRALVNEWKDQETFQIERGVERADAQRKQLKNLEARRTFEVNADPRMEAIAKREASLNKLNSGLDNTREILQGVQAISKFTRMLSNHFLGDSDAGEIVNKVLDYVDLAINIAVVAIDAVKSIANAFSSGGGMGVFGVVTAVANLAASIFGMFNPQPDPYLEAAKAISEQITQMYNVMNQRFDQVMEQLQNMNQSLSWQMNVFNHQVDARFDGLQRQLDDMSVSLTRQLQQLDAALVSGLRMTRREIRDSTQQVLASIVWSHDDLVNRMEMANQGFKSDLQGLNALMSTQLLADLNEIDVMIANAEREHGKAAALVALQNDPARLQQMRDRLESGIRNKLLAGGISRPLASLCFDSFENAEVMNMARVMATDHFAECFAFYYASQGADSRDHSSKVWNSTAVAFPLSRRFLRLQSWYARWLENPLSIMAAVAELVDAPVARSRQFLVGLQQDKEFFSRLLDRYLERALELLRACRGVTVREFGQTLRLPSSLLTDTPALLPLMFDRLPRLGLSNLALDTLESNRPQRRDQDISALQAYFDAPAGNWRLQKLCRTLVLGHALNACELRLDGDDSTRALVMRYAGKDVSIVSMSVQDDRVLSVALPSCDNGLFVALGEDCRQIQQQWIAAYNRRIPQDCSAELKALDASISQLALFLGLAGATAQQIEQVLGLCWNSQSVVAYLEAQAELTSLGKDRLSPPLALLAAYTDQLSKQAQTLVESTLAALAARPSSDDELPSLRDSLLAQLDLLEQQAKDLRGELAGRDLSDVLRAHGLAEEDGLLRLPLARLREGMTFEMTPGIQLREGCRLTLAGSGRFDLTYTDGVGRAVVQKVDLDDAIAQIDLVSAAGQENLAALGIGVTAQEHQDVWLEGIWIKEAEIRAS